MDKYLIVLMSVHYFYTVGFGFYMFTRRKKAVRNDEVKIQHFKSYQGKTTEELAILQNHFNNQFQIPLIFYIVSLLAIQQNKVTVLMLIVATVFILSRLFHAYIHLGHNHVFKRALAYMVGIVCVGIMFILSLI